MELFWGLFCWLTNWLERICRSLVNSLVPHTTERRRTADWRWVGFLQKLTLGFSPQASSRVCAFRIQLPIQPCVSLCTSREARFEFISNEFNWCLVEAVLSFMLTSPRTSIFFDVGWSEESWPFDSWFPAKSLPIHDCLGVGTWFVMVLEFNNEEILW